MADINKITASVLTYGGSVEPTTAEIEQGESITLNIQPKDGFDIASVTNNGDNVPEAEYPGGNYKFTPDRDCDVDIIFSKEDGLFYYGIEIIKPENGNINLNDDGSGYMDGNIAVVISLSHPTFYIVPNGGYEVSDVLVDGSSVWFEGINKYTFNEVRGNHTITATFRPTQPQPTDTVIITASSNPEDGGDTYGGGKYNVGDNVTMSAQPHSGYEFDCWTNKKGDVISTGSTFEFTADYDRTLIANFSKKKDDMTPSQKGIYIACQNAYTQLNKQFYRLGLYLQKNEIGSIHEPLTAIEDLIKQLKYALDENGGF